MTITLTRPRTTGRHRLGRPGLIPVSAFATIVRRGLLRSWLRPGRHSAREARVVWQRPTPGRRAGRRLTPAAGH